MKLTYSIESSFGHTVFKEEIKCSFETLQKAFNKGIKTLEKFRKKEIGENEFLYCEYSVQGINDLFEQKLYDILFSYYN